MRTEKVIELNSFAKAQIRIDAKPVAVEYFVGVFNGVRIICIGNPVFEEKTSVYTYTAEDEKNDPSKVRGQGHTDAVLMNCIFQKAILEYIRMSHEIPDVLICHDAHTALLPAMISEDPEVAPLMSNTRMISVIHNAGPGYLQEFHNPDWAAGVTGLSKTTLLEGCCHGTIKPFLIAAAFSRMVTVSPWYAKELLNPDFPYSEGLSAEFHRRNIPIEGITNGIDYQKYDPCDKNVSLLPVTYDPSAGNLSGKKECLRLLLAQLSPEGVLTSADVELFGCLDGDTEAVYFCYHGRIASQKGLDVLSAAAERVLSERADCRFIVIGQGDPALEAQQIALAQRYPGRYVYLRGYNRSLVRLIIAASGFIVLPSRFEPCGLEDFIGQIYGTIPAAHAVGGLNKILDGKTGFLYHHSDDSSDALTELLNTLAEKSISSPEELDRIRVTAAEYVKNEYSWDEVICKKYLPFFAKTY
jgi:starch synthase